MNVEISLLDMMCDENIYRNNAFHILRVPSNVAMRQIRRRKEDLESAKELGSENWSREFVHWLAKTEVPTYEQVAEAFSFIEDPVKRIISEFFWVWPLDDKDVAVSDFLLGHRDAAMKEWLNCTHSTGRTRSISQHNLAVVNHALAIEEELSILDGGGDGNRHQMEAYWEKAFAYWEELADDDDFWEIYETRMREFDDPRLTGGFIRRFRKEFPIAFDNINAKIALAYAKQGMVNDAKRHVEYMKRTMSGIDDIAQSFDQLFEPLERQVELVIMAGRNQVSVDATMGAKCATEILDSAENILRAATCLLEPNNGRRLRMLSKIFEACNSFLVAFGNQTKQWDVCLELNKRLLPFACTEELRKRVESNQAIIQDNFNHQIEEKVCVGCGRQEGQKRLFGSIVHIKKQKVKMYGNLRKNYESFGGVKYSKIEIDVPCCDKCKCLTVEQVRASKVVEEALREGYKIGEEPSQWDMRKAWGLPGETEHLQRKDHVSFLLEVAIGIVATLAASALVWALIHYAMKR